MTSPPSENSPHLNVEQLAERWQTTKAAIYIARHRGKAPAAFKRGGNVLFPIAEVERYEAAQMAGDRLSHRGTTAEHRPPEAQRPRHRRKPAAA
ncbi:DNA-binding protein [Streptomyces sp. ME02-8801-2C]|uniref:helix-turn-helix transcriptional regulator n=1 Tax=Streptomyces sp. ME02-8801-2C TaxID=3028680 RepID=UPI0029AEFA6C|nr:DNA-binding protein [Streptomyces sp. ME02-8801-2C]MDX3455099.1 DNA-binding protein [Streptomyces sp. ME02-8801-2C]